MDVTSKTRFIVGKSLDNYTKLLKHTPSIKILYTIQTVKCELNDPMKNKIDGMKCEASN